MMLRAILLASLLALPARAEPPAWKHGVLLPKADAGIILMPARGGFGTAQGIDLQISVMKDDTGLIRALLAGELDSIEGGSATAILAASRGAPPRVLGCYWTVVPYGVFAKAEITEIAQLRGRAIAVSGPSAAPDLVARAMLAHAGIPRGEVRMADMGGDGDRYKAVTAGVVDATVVSLEYTPLANAAGVHMLVRGSDVLPNYPRICITTSTSAIANRRADLVAFVAAEIAGLRHAMSDREASLALTREIIHIGADDPRPAFMYDDARANGTIDTEMGIPMDKLAWLQDELIALGNMKTKVSLDGIVDPSLRRDALARLETRK